ncbi:Fic family protein [Clostridium sp. FP2]|uniref:Fic family protein n=1 Tax=Clostridium sp. FP2 TaxID=2724481 RepID=UPI001CCDB68E|nr:Fic family protein [Clostridium sp. FP2]MBZ9621404.1 Fic family protein [Clostridium sp. FP2]
MYKECIKLWREGLSQELINRFFIKCTYSSSKIENNEIILRDVEAVFKGEKVINFKGSEKTITEIENHKSLCENIFKISKENNSKLLIDLIKQFHYVLMKDCFKEELIIKGEKPGEFRRGIVGLYDVGVDPIEIEKNLNSLIEEMNNVQVKGDNALKVMSYFLCYFESIHPFTDNGKVGRMLLNYLLIANNLPPIVIFYNDKKEYYLALEQFNETQQIDKMIRFLEDQAYKTWIKDYNFKLKGLKYFLD